MPAVDTLESHLEAQIALATRLIDGGILEYVYGCGHYTDQRIDYWEGIRVRAEEQLYNLRHGDLPCPPKDLEE